jgi:hypothetical protein
LVGVLSKSRGRWHVGRRFSSFVCEIHDLYLSVYL